LYLKIADKDKPVPGMTKYSEGCCGSIPFALVAILIFFPAPSWSMNGKIIWFSVLYMMYMVVFTIYHISYGALGGTMTQNSDDRGSLFGYRLGSSSAMYWVLSTLFINPATNIVLFFVLAAIAGYFQGLITASVYACMLDTIELGQLNTGIRASAFIVSLCHFSNKLGMTIITAATGGILAFLGYVANAEQNANVLMAMNVIFTLAAGIIGIGLGIMFMFYKLDRKAYYDVLEKLKLKEAELPTTD
jgi:GPH family glycoside/pentoside/hexuronide:cation symporter